MGGCRTRSWVWSRGSVSFCGRMARGMCHEDGTCDESYIDVVRRGFASSSLFASLRRVCCDFGFHEGTGIDAQCERPSRMKA